MNRQETGDAIKRGRGKRTWIKLHCEGTLRGSINYQLELEEQAIWMKMLAFTAVCGGEDGWIQDNDKHPLPHFFIANNLHCPLEVFETTLEKCITEGRCKENSTGIEITNWSYYQSEYDRQKPYREGKKGKKLHKVCPACGLKALTSEEHCPTCEEKGQTILLGKDFKGGEYGSAVQT